MRVVEVVWRTDREVVDATLFRPVPQLLEVAVEALELGEERDVKAQLVEPTDRVMRVRRCNQAAAGSADRLEMPRRDHTANARHREVHRRPIDKSALASVAVK